MIGLEQLYVLVGLLFAGFALDQAFDRAWRSALFWGCFAVLMGAGSWLAPLASGALVIVLALLAAIGLKPKPIVTTDAPAREASASRLGNRLFVPALAIPFVTVLGTLLLPRTGWVVPKDVTLVALALGALAGLALAMTIVRAGPMTAMREGRRLVDSVGWAAVLPQALAALGGVFAAAGMGDAVAKVVTATIPIDTGPVAVVIYCLGMALFTIVMGNAFAAFPVMTAGIGLPLIVHRFGGDPVIMSAVGMLSGFCGTLLTPMAANFNIVPAAVLELKDRYKVIKVQAPTAFVLLAANMALMALTVFKRWI
ncbi:MAG TPA: DUF979 domain-containing protein [Rhizomicrobium sp.]|nr:DUF979 domain-containing protein [Rhizomicrobium sp.]